MKLKRKLHCVQLNVTVTANKYKTKGHITPPKRRTVSLDRNECNNGVCFQDISVNVGSMCVLYEC